MSESYQELDLDNLGAPNVADDIELVNEGEGDVEVVDDKPARIPTTQVEEEDDDEDGAAAPERKGKLTRSQRLKNQRDNYARELEESRKELAALRSKATKAESEATEAAGIGMDFYLKTIEADMRSLRTEFNTAMDNGDRDKLWEVQQKMVELGAEKKAAEREKRNIVPTKAAAPGKEAQPSTPTPPSRGASKNPLTDEWVARHESWFNKDKAMTAATFAIDSEMASEGYTPNEPEYFEELDRRVKEAFPHKFTAKPARSAGSSTPTIQNRAGGQSMPTGKIRVVVTAEDRATAESLGIDITDYARQKAKRDRAQATASQYTEIF